MTSKQEMPLMLELGRRYGVDMIFFNKIENWNTKLDFSNQTFTTNRDFKLLLDNLKKDNMFCAPTLF